MHSIAALLFCLLQLNLIFVNGSSMLSESFIASVNEKAKTWTAGNNFPGFTHAQLKRLAGLKDDYDQHLPDYRPHVMASRKRIPAFFDSRVEWANCSTISEIYDQGNCGSCWAVSSATVMSDRMCIHSNETVHVSPLDVLTCCPTCGDCNDGGYPTKAFEYWNRTGIVSGGPYNSSDGCRPYSLPPAGTTLRRRSILSKYIPTPACERTCEEGYNNTYADDKSHGQAAYRVGSRVEEIQREIMENGPVVVAFLVYQDFYAYRSGVYQHTLGFLMGGHAVRLIGWGVEGGVDYWLVANSWNSGWGDSGTFKILRGTNHCGIEQRVVAGIPL